jgi:hypothetical protein
MAYRVTPRIARWSHAALLAILVIVTSFQTPIFNTEADTFHEGEYTMYAVPGWDAVSHRMPVLIHGGIDYIPARLAAAICAPDHQLACVRAMNAGLTAAAGGVFVAVLSAIVGLGTIQAIIAGLPAVVLLIAYDGTAAMPVRLQQSSPALRDLVVLLTLLCIAWLVRTERRLSAGGRCALLAACGCIAGVGLLWTYDRGLIAVLVAVGAGSYLSLVERQWRPLVWLAAGLACGLALAAASGVYGDIADNFGNILYWCQHGDIWRLTRDPAVLFSAARAAMLGGVLLCLACVAIWRDIRHGRPGQALTLLSLAVVMGLYAIQTYERPDVIHLTWILWVVTLLAAALLREAMHPAVSRASPVAVAVLAILTGFVVASYNIPRTLAAPGRWLDGLALNLRALQAPLPRNQDLVPPGLAEAAAIIHAHPAACTYSLSNEGLLYVLARLPPCSRFAYPAYVSTGTQAAVIAELQRMGPPIVLASSPYWSNAIDGKTLAMRTPALAAWTAQHYPYRLNLPDGYVLRSRILLDATKE